MDRWLDLLFAAALAVFAWRAGAEWFIAWYSGVDPDLTKAQQAWLLARIVACLAAAVALAWPPPAP
jgi:hypothetical protein